MSIHGWERTLIKLKLIICEAFKAVKTPAISKFISPQKCSRSNSDPDEFIKNYERTNIFDEWSAYSKIRYFGTYLEGASNRCFEKYHKNNDNNSWDDIVEAFKT